MKRVSVTVAVLLLGLLTLSACGDNSVPAPDTPEVPVWAKVAPEQIAEAKKHGVPVAFENDLGMRFVLIPAGTFLMGSPEDEEGRDGIERQHEVTLERPFYMQVAEVTNAQYRRLRPSHDSKSYWELPLNAGLQPVVRLSLANVAEYARWASDRDDARTYRLPTEAEWEYACRAGTQGRFSWGESEAAADRYANGNDPKTVAEVAPFQRKEAFPHDDPHRVTAPVCAYLPNTWGMYDLHGNALEWCGGRYASYPDGGAASPTESVLRLNRVGVLRGGFWMSGPEHTRSAKRFLASLDHSGSMAFGFRLVSPLPESSR